MIREFPHNIDRLQFSTRSWSSLRIIVVVSRGPDSPVSVFVMEGPFFGVSDDSWTAWQLVTQNHSMPMRPADGSAFHGARGADAFLRALPSFGIVAVVEKMRHWRAFLNRGDRRKVPLVDSRFFDDGEGGISVSRQFASSMRAGRLAAGDVASYVPYNAKSQSAKAVPALMRHVPVALARWMGRYGLDVDAPTGTVVELGDPHFPDDVADPAAPTALESAPPKGKRVSLGVGALEDGVDDEAQPSKRSTKRKQQKERKREAERKKRPTDDRKPPADDRKPPKRQPGTGDKPPPHAAGGDKSAPGQYGPRPQGSA